MRKAAATRVLAGFLTGGTDTAGKLVLRQRLSTVRGFSAVSLLIVDIVDEVARMDDDAFEALRPMLAVSDGDLRVMSTPRGKTGFFYETWQHGGADWHRVAVPATENPRISASFLEGERRQKGGDWFRQEYLCEFVDSGTEIFGRELVERALDPTMKPLFQGPNSGYRP